MKKLKDLFEKFLFTVEEVEEVVEDKPEPIVEEIPVEKPAPVRKPKVEPVVDGYVGFLFLDKNGKPRVALHWEKYFQLSVEKYNSIYKEELPLITPHVCRHTYCTNKAKSGMNPKTLQYLMGHSEIGVTMDTYTHLGIEDAWNELERMQLEYSQKELGLRLVKTA